MFYVGYKLWINYRKLKNKQQEKIPTKNVGSIYLILNMTMVTKLNFSQIDVSLNGKRYIYIFYTYCV